MGKNWKHRRDDAGSMLATVLVIVGGAAVCAFMSASDTSFRGELMMGVVVGSAILLLSWIIWYRYGRNSSSNLSFWFSVSRNHREEGLAAQYRPRKVRDKQSEVPSGTNRPITAEEAHEIQQQSANAWVPTRTHNDDADD